MKDLGRTSEAEAFPWLIIHLFFDFVELFPDHILEPSDFFDEKDLARKINLIDL